MQLTLSANEAYQLLVALATALEKANDPTTANEATVSVHISHTVRDAITTSNRTLADDSTRGVVPPPPPPPFPFPLLVTLARALQVAHTQAAAGGPTVSVHIPDTVKNAILNSNTTAADTSTRGNP